MLHFQATTDTTTADPTNNDADSPPKATPEK